jgi:hypothetical protein
MPSASKGTERETFAHDFLEAVFPAPFRFGSGAVTDSEGNLSGQIDIVIEHPFLPSFPMPGGSERLYLAESVAAVLEIKSNLADQWDQVEGSVAKFRKIKRRWGAATRITGNTTSVFMPSVVPIPYVAIGYTGFKTIKQMENRFQGQPADDLPHAILTIDSGVFISGEKGLGSATGPLGLYALCMLLNQYVQGVVAANIDFAAYAK